MTELEARRARLRRLLQAYYVFWEVGDVAEFSPWPGDPDGGELRVVGALEDVLEHLTPRGIRVLEDKLLEGSREYGPVG